MPDGLLLRPGGSAFCSRVRTRDSKGCSWGMTSMVPQRYPRPCCRAPGSSIGIRYCGISGSEIAPRACLYYCRLYTLLHISPNTFPRNDVEADRCSSSDYPPLQSVLSELLCHIATRASIWARQGQAAASFAHRAVSARRAAGASSSANFRPNGWRAGRGVDCLGFSPIAACFLDSTCIDMLAAAARLVLGVFWGRSQTKI